MKQFLLIKSPPLEFGGTLNKGKRKTARPLATKRPLHLVLKARNPDLFGERAFVESEVRRLATRFGLTVYKIAVNHDHLHIALLSPGRAEYNRFVRALAGLLARKFGKWMWKLTPYSRVLSWGRDFRNVLVYLEKNREEARGIEL